MSIVYVLLIYKFNYGFQFDHVEVYKSKAKCESPGKHLPIGFYPNFQIINNKAKIVCQKVEISK